MTVQAPMTAHCGKCENCLIHNRAICRVADDAAIEELNRISHLREYTRGQIIQGEREDSLLVGNVVEGVVKLLNSSIDGAQHVIGLLYPSDFFGRIYAEVSPFAYEAATDTALCCIDRHAFESFLSRHPEIEHELFISKLDELDAVREWSTVVSGHTTMQRVATFLYILSKRSRNQHCVDEDGEKPVITVPISRRDVAAYLGTTPETLSRNIQALSRAKVIRIIDARHFELLNRNALISQSGEAEEDLDAIAVQ